MNDVDEKLALLSKIIKKRLRDDWDLVIAVSGEEGVGKSRLAIKLGGLVDKNFNMEKNMSLIPDAEEIEREFKALSKGSIYIIDEAIRGLHKHDWAKSIQKTVTKMYATERWQRKCTIMNIPRFRDLAESFRNYRVKMWIHVITRGHAIVYYIDHDKDTSDPWNIERNIKIKKGLLQKRVIYRKIEDMIKMERKTPNYAFDFKFDDFASKEKKEYLDLKIASRERMDEIDFEVKKPKTGKRLEKNIKVQKAMFTNLYEKHGFKFFEIVKCADGLISNDTVANIIKGYPYDYNANTEGIFPNITKQKVSGLKLDKLELVEVKKELVNVDRKDLKCI